VSKKFQERLAAAAHQPLVGGLRGIEKESLRVSPDGLIAKTPHPDSLGSALTNRFITTDYSEALPEFVTPPLGSSWEAIQFLCDIHQFVHAAISDEMLWAASMPCRLRSENDIPIAGYGTSNIGQMKTIYRRGLGYRYGRYMQAISGIHFNYSVPEEFWKHYCDSEKSQEDAGCFRSNSYLGLVRNVRRMDWLLLYLFGASPAVCKSFLAGSEVMLEELDHGTYFGPHATSLRMSNIGYQNANQSRLNVSANSLDEYVTDLSRAVRTPNPDYQKIGVKVNGEYRQLNANQLQIENEYYSTIRPKRVAKSGEHPTEALRRRGVEYIELRALDVSPFDPIGISHADTLFLEIFTIYCLLSDSPPISADEQLDNTNNHAAVARTGRRPGLELVRFGKQVPLADWGQQIVAQMQEIAEVLESQGGKGYSDAIAAQARAIRDPQLTPSARLIAELHETGQPMADYGLQLSLDHKNYFLSLAPDMNSHWDMLHEETESSLHRQAQIEASDSLDFDAYLADYFS